MVVVVVTAEGYDPSENERNSLKDANKQRRLRHPETYKHAFYHCRPSRARYYFGPPPRAFYIISSPETFSQYYFSGSIIINSAAAAAVVAEGVCAYENTTRVAFTTPVGIHDFQTILD